MVFNRRIRIQLDGGNDRTFFPGALVSGVVEYVSITQDVLKSLNLVFRGVSKVLPKRGSKTGQEHIELFHMAQVLVSHPLRIVPRKSYTWDFTFVMPLHTGPDRLNIYTDSGNALFQEQAHPLPPHLDSSQSEAVRIEYHMYAIASRACNGTFAASQWEEPVVCNIDSVRCMPDVHNLQDRPVQSLERMIDVFPTIKRRFSLGSSIQANASQLPLRSLTLVIDVPSVIALGDMIQISLRARSATAIDSTVSIVPCASVQLISTALVSCTYRRTAKISHNDSLTESKTKVLGAFKSVGMLPFDSLTQVRLFPTCSVQSWPPSFKSYSISRSYFLVVEVVVVCEKRETVAKFETPVEVVHAVAHETALARRESHAPPPPLPFQGPRDESDELPSYEDVSRGASVAAPGAILSPAIGTASA